jgi:thiol:disulfide interchange protein DsbA
MGDSHNPATRRFLKAAAIGGVALAAAPLRAQKAPEAGIQYREIKPAQSTDSPGKIEVLEFFWYGCPHCNTLEPALKDWVKRLPADVVFRKVHVGLGPSWVPHQQMFYALESMGKAAEVNDRIFAAIHVDRMPLGKPEQMADFLAKLGVDRKQFLDAYESFAVRTKMRKATSTAQAYGLDGVPAMAVNGRWFTAPSMAGGNAQALAVVDYLIDLERKRR